MIELDRPEIPPVIEAWVKQLLDPGLLALLRAYPAEQVDVRLSASRGKVRRRPIVTFNGGPTDMVEP